MEFLYLIFKLIKYSNHYLKITSGNKNSMNVEPESYLVYYQTIANYKNIKSHLIW